jgi:hypothetical protein
MTETDWLTSTNPLDMLNFLQGSGNTNFRKHRLFAAACCRRIWDLIRDERSQRAVEVTELFADGREIPPEWLAQARAAPVYECHFQPAPINCFACDAAASSCLPNAPLGSKQEYIAFSTAINASDALRHIPHMDNCSDPEEYIEAAAACEDEQRVQANLLRCIFGLSPLRPLPPLAPSLRDWQDGLIVRMAHAIYEERSLPEGTLDIARLAVLADALEEAGADTVLLDHLRGPGLHVRGCWLVDLLTGRS